MYQRERKYQEAIDTFYEADNPPDNLFRIVDCYNSMDRLNSARKQQCILKTFSRARSRVVAPGVSVS